MQAPILLSTGAVARYPLGRQPKYATKLNVFSDFSTQSFAQLQNRLGSWALNLALLKDHELHDWQDFHDAMQGQNTLFTFADPWDNLLAYSELLENATWIKGSDAFIGKNYILWSEDLTSPPWSTNANGAGGAPTVTGNATAAPDGNVTADKVIFPAAGSGNPEIFQLATAPVVDGNTTVTFSIWLKTDTTGTVHINVGDNISQVASANAALTSSWQRFSVTLTFSASAGTLLSGVILNPAGSSAINVYAWGAQIEYGSAPSDYTKTTSTATELQIADPFWTAAPSGFTGSAFGLNSGLPKRGRQIVFKGTTNPTLDQLVALGPGGSGNSRAFGLQLTFSFHMKRQAASPPTLNLQLGDGPTLSESALAAFTPTSAWIRNSLSFRFSASNPASEIQARLYGSAIGTAYIFGGQLDLEATTSRYKQTQAVSGVHPMCRFASDTFQHSVDSFDQNTLASFVIQEYGG